MPYERTNRREFLALTGTGTLCLTIPSQARAEQQRIYRVGLLGAVTAAAYAHFVQALVAKLHRLGYVEGDNLQLESRWAEGKYDRLPQLAADLVASKIDVLVTHGTPGARAALTATKVVPIVAISASDPVANGLVANLQRPGGNMTGLTFFYAEICAKRVELLKEALPTVSRVAVPVNPANDSWKLALNEMTRVAAASRIELFPSFVQSAEELPAAFAAFVKQKANGVAMIEEPLFISNTAVMAEAALKYRLPMISLPNHVATGVLLGYGVDLHELWAGAAVFIDKLLKGAKAADLPIERATKFDLMINQKTAKALGITIPVSLLVRADEVVT
jgi:putative ABC transport system substrate-binding protein